MPQGWGNFYFMLGGASATLIGLMFVVCTLTSASPDPGRTERAQTLFMTPTAFNFGAALAMSALGLMPNLSCMIYQAFAAVVVVTGLVRIGFVAATFLRPSPDFQLHWSDPWCYAWIPTIIYGALAASLASLSWRGDWAFDAVGLCLIALLMMSVRNAWDLITFLAPRSSTTQASPSTEAAQG